MGIFKWISSMVKEEFDYRKELSKSYKNKPIEAPKTSQAVVTLYEQAIDIIFQREQASASILERYLKIDFNTASDVLNHLEARGIISGFNGSIPRKILVSNASQAKRMLNNSITARQPVVSFDPGIHVRTDTYTVYFAYGHVQNVVPPLPGGYYENRDIINAATFIVSDGVAYDLTDEHSIRSIKTPNYHIYAPNKVGEELGVTGCLDYVLRMHAGLCWGRNMEIAIACLEKATQLMKYSTVGWQQKDFYRIVNWLTELGRFKEAKEWEIWIVENTQSEQDIMDDTFQRCLDSCDYLDTDLVEVGDSGVCCEKCAMYRKRIYSLSGKDKRFPHLPKDFHMHCGLSVHPFVYGVMEPTFNCDDIVKYSNRPFLDDRTPEDIARREEWLETIEKEKFREREASLSKIIYYKLKKILPDDCPKSLSGFSRMRNANSKNYQALVKKAEAAGFVFPETLEEVEQWPENQ